jgi:curved DNA-binding protein
MPVSNHALEEARRILGVDADAEPETLRQAFNAAVKAAHPDRTGGDGERLRQVIEAYRALDGLQDIDADAVANDVVVPVRLEIGALQSIHGGWAHLVLDDGREISVRLPAGLRAGEVVRISGRTFRISVLNGAGAFVSGDDVMTTARVGAGLMAEGGRLMIETPTGKTSVWISKADAERGFARLKGLGLPARAGRPQGDLLLRLRPSIAGAADLGVETLTRLKRHRFAAAWAA